jgi:hypothetical protein
MRLADSSYKLWHRRDVIKLLGATAITGPVTFCGTSANAATPKVIKIGHVSPRTGALAPFAEADSFILDQIRAVLAKGITNGGVTYEVQIISKDSQSNTNRASEVATDLILKDKVDLLLASSTPETTNPVADQAEANETPCITDNAPWQSYFFGRHGTPDKGFHLDIPFLLGGGRRDYVFFSPSGNRSRPTKWLAYFSRMTKTEMLWAIPELAFLQPCRKRVTNSSIPDVSRHSATITGPKSQRSRMRESKL